MKKLNWMIHYVQEHDCECCGKHEPIENHVGFDMFANIHTHGFKDNGHDEVCIPLDIGFQLSGQLLNIIGIKIRDKGVKYNEGRDSTVLQNLDVLFYRSNDSDTLYMIMPDPNGLFPEDENCMHPYNKQIFYANIIEEDNNNG